MKNEEAKREAIKKAWGETIYPIMEAIMKREGDNWYGGFKRHGEVYGNFVPELLKQHINSDRIDNLNGWYKPKELKGIEDNNGWTRIEPDGSNLPKTNSEVWYETYPNHYLYTSEGLEQQFEGGEISHFKPRKPTRPVY